jgi:hypothetical protein
VTEPGGQCAVLRHLVHGDSIFGHQTPFVEYIGKALFKLAFCSLKTDAVKILGKNPTPGALACVAYNLIMRTYQSIFLFILLLATPTFSNVLDCKDLFSNRSVHARFSEEQVIYDFEPSMPSAFFHFIKNGARRIAEITDRKGNILLFRLIDGEYDPTVKPGNTMNGKPIVSFSTSPAIAWAWAPSIGSKNLTVVVAEQNVITQTLYRDQLGEIAKPNSFLHTRRRGSSTLNEIQVPFDSVNVVLTLSRDEFAQLMNKVGQPGENLNLKKLAEEIRLAISKRH